MRAALLFVEMSPDGRVWAVRSFGDWFLNQFARGAHPAEQVLRRPKELDAWDSKDQELADALFAVVASPAVPADRKAAAVGALPAALVGPADPTGIRAARGNDYRAALEQLTKSENAALKAAAQAKLAEADRR